MTLHRLIGSSSFLYKIIADVFTSWHRVIRSSLLNDDAVQFREVSTPKRLEVTDHNQRVCTFVRWQEVKITNRGASWEVERIQEEEEEDGAACSFQESLLRGAVGPRRTPA